MVRNARNSVRHLMNYKAYITPEMQLNWFHSINNSSNFYYIIQAGEGHIGLIHEKNASIHAGELLDNSEGGIFLFREEYHNHPAAVLAALILIEKGFYLFGDRQSVIHIQRDNEKAIRFNEKLGYQLLKGEETNVHQKYILTKENFIKKTSRLRKAALRLSRSDNTLTCIMDKNDYLSSFGMEIEKINNEAGFYFSDYKDGARICQSSIPLD